MKNHIAIAQVVFIYMCKFMVTERNWLDNRRTIFICVHVK
jgi:hypothetical protein